LLPKDKKLEESRAEAKLAYGHRKETVIGTMEDDMKECYTRLLEISGGRDLCPHHLRQASEELLKKNASQKYDPIRPMSTSSDPETLLGLLSIGAIEELIEAMTKKTESRMSPGEKSASLEELSKTDRHLVGTGFGFKKSKDRRFNPY